MKATYKCNECGRTEKKIQDRGKFPSKLKCACGKEMNRIFGEIAVDVAQGLHGNSMNSYNEDVLGDNNPSQFTPNNFLFGNAGRDGSFLKEHEK